MGASVDLGGGRWVRQSRAYWMNSTLLFGAGHAVVVDPGVLPSELEDLASAVRASGAREATLVFTHGHWDHVLGRPWWPDARTVAHATFAAQVRGDRDRIRSEAVALAAEHGEEWTGGFEPFAPDMEVAGTQEILVGPWRCVFRDAPGHCDSQVSIHLPEAATLIAADMLSDIEPPLLNRAPDAYRATLEMLLPVAESGAIETLVPGHGAVALGRDACLARIRGDLAYLDALATGVIAALAAGHPLEETQRRLEAGMTYTGQRSTAYPMSDAHRKNVRITYEALAAAR